MKKILAVLTALVLALSVSAVFASAASGADVLVTISDESGKLAVAAEKVTVTDIDNDGALTVNDALYAAHEKFYEGGAAAGYGTETTQWGLGITKLWGTANGGSYGYMVNNASAWSLADPVKDGDYVAAYVFTEPKTLADKYAYFDKLIEDVQAGEITLTLSMNDFDADWNPITLPVKGAVITVDGVATDVKTDENGKATIKLEVNGKHLVSATATDKVIAPPVYIPTVSGGVDPVPATTPESATVAPTTAPTAASSVAPTQKATTKATADSKTTTTNTNAVKTGSSAFYVVLAFAMMALAVAVITKKRYEK